MSTTKLVTKLDSLPDSLKKEVDDFINFLILKSIKGSSANIARFGSAKGFYKMADDFDEPLDDFKEYME